MLPIFVSGDNLAGDFDALDVEGTYAEWMGSIDAVFFILRPDFYVAATANSAGDLSQRFDEVFVKLQIKNM